MININIYNYEEFVLDYLEGNLSPEKRDEFVMFINAHPDIKEEIESVQDYEISADQIEFDDKDLLKKTSDIKDIGIFDYNCIASIEGDLSEDGNHSFLESLKDDIKKKQEYEKYQLTKLKADTSVVFDKKTSLKKTNKLRVMYYAISAAASIILLVSIYLFIPKNIPDTKLADLETVVKNVEQNNESVIPEKTAVETKVLKRSSIQKSETIKESKRVEEGDLIKEKHQDILIASDQPVREQESISSLPTLPVSINVKNEINLQLAVIIEVQQVKIDRTEYLNVKTFLAQSFNKRVLRKDKKTLELFDIAQASVNGLNKVFGGNMKLERVYNDNGELDKTQFTSSLVAISTPVKNK